jgi:hypothetical protein
LRNAASDHSAQRKAKAKPNDTCSGSAFILLLKLPVPFVFDDVSGFELAETFIFDALIGMDILAQCAFSMERDGRCSLTFGS